MFVQHCLDGNKDLDYETAEGPASPFRLEPLQPFVIQQMHQCLLSLCSCYGSLWANVALPFPL